MLKYIFFFSLSSVALAAKLDNVYLPPHQRVATAGGAGAGLQAPRGGGFGGNRGFGGAGAAPAPAPAVYSGSSQAASAASQAQIVKSESEINEQGFHYSFETSDGTKAEQQGRVIPGAKPEEGSIQVSGSYSYVGDDGMTYSVTYTADENGYQAQGAHLPTPPPIPEAIMKSLELIAGMNQRNNNQYSNQRSSYDADREHPGYTY